VDPGKCRRRLQYLVPSLYGFGLAAVATNASAHYMMNRLAHAVEPLDSRVDGELRNPGLPPPKVRGWC
jgi:hypothetical protein